MALVMSEWGLAGIEALKAQVSVLVIVDVLSFSTAVDIAVSRGAAIYPTAEHGPEAEAMAARNGGVLAQRQRSATVPSLSPASLLDVAEGLKLVLPSPNGALLSLAGGSVPVLAGSLRNAGAVAEAARKIAGAGAIGIIPAGERWPDGGLRPAIEDLLGAGAIIEALGLDCSPEARIARDAYRAAGAELADLIRDSVSGRELSDRGFACDVELALAQDVSRSIPFLSDGAYRALPVRPSARLLVIDPQHRVLLFRFVHRRGPLAGQTFWATPGGGLEPGESFEVAAKRELEEETGLKDVPIGAEIGRRTPMIRLPTGEPVLSDERLFVVRATDSSLSREGWTDLEREVMADHRWWSAAELAETGETIYPETIAELLSAALQAARR